MGRLYKIPINALYLINIFRSFFLSMKENYYSRLVDCQTPFNVFILNIKKYFLKMSNTDFSYNLILLL